MNQKQKEKWEKTRTQGQSEFVLKEGGLKFGFLLFGIIVPIVRFIVEFIVNDFTFSFIDKSFQLGILFNLFAAFPAGCFLYWIIWHWTEYRYSQNNHKQ